jgi:hypothetical protein
MARLAAMAVVCSVCVGLDLAGAHDAGSSPSGYRTDVYVRDRAEEVRAALIRGDALSIEGLRLQGEAARDRSLREVQFRLTDVFPGRVGTLDDALHLSKVRPDRAPVQGRARQMTVRNDRTRPDSPAVVLHFDDVVLECLDGRVVVVKWWSLTIPNSQFEGDR